MPKKVLLDSKKIDIILNRLVCQLVENHKDEMKKLDEKHHGIRKKALAELESRYKDEILKLESSIEREVYAHERAASKLSQQHNHEIRKIYDLYK